MRIRRFSNTCCNFAIAGLPWVLKFQGTTKGSLLVIQPSITLDSNRCHCRCSLYPAFISAISPTAEPSIKFLTGLYRLFSSLILSLRNLKPDGTVMIVEPFANDKLEDNLNLVGRMYYAASTMVCVPGSMAFNGPALGAQAGEAKIGEVV
jgi:hypothetical protein